MVCERRSWGATDLPSVANGSDVVLVTTCGIIVADVIAARLPSVPKPGRVLLSPHRIGLHVGGHASNVSVDLCKLGLKGEQVSLIGCIGTDMFGDFIAKDLARRKIVTHLDRIKHVETSRSIVLDLKGEDRRVVHSVGANWYLDPQKVQKTLRKDAPVIFYVGAPGMLGEFDVMLPSILKQAKTLGCVTFVDAVIPYKRPSNLIAPALRWTDILHCNDGEAKEITREKNVLNAAKTLVRYGANVVTVTGGSKGGIALTRNLLLHFPSFHVKTVDPLGAGDAFCSGMIIKLLELQGRNGARSFLQDLSLRRISDMIMYGAAAGAACCLSEGTTTSVTRKNVEELLRAQSTRFRAKTKWANRSD